MKKCSIILILFVLSLNLFADHILLKTGNIVKGTILTHNEDYIKIKFKNDDEKIYVMELVKSFHIDPKPSPIKGGKILGTVIDSASNPVQAEIEIFLDSVKKPYMTTSTSKFGEFKFKELKDGVYLIVCKAEGFTTLKEELTLGKEKIIERDFIVLPAAIHGKVVDCDFAVPLIDAFLELVEVIDGEPDDETMKEMIVNEDGDFRFEVPQGKYNLFVTCSNYKDTLFTSIELTDVDSFYVLKMTPDIDPYPYRRKSITRLPLKFFGVKTEKSFMASIIDFTDPRPKPKKGEPDIQPFVGKSKRVESYIKKNIKREIEIDRFDYNEIKALRVSDDVFTVEGEGKGFNTDKISQYIEEEIAPVITAILSDPSISEARASKNISEAARILGAKFGLNPPLREKDFDFILNSAYLYFPYVTEWYLAMDEKKEYWNAYIYGGIVWFKINNKDGEVTVTKVVDRSNGTKGVKRIATKKGDIIEHMWFGDGKMKKIGAKEAAMKGAIYQFARNLQVATLSGIPEFRLEAPFITLDSKKVGQFEIAGRDYSIKDDSDQQGIRLDDKFSVGEWVEQEDSTLVFQTTGYGFVKKVGINSGNKEDARSKLYAISGWLEEGQVVKETPLQRVDVNCGYKFKTISIVDSLGEDLSININGLEFALHGNLGERLRQHTNKQFSQLYVSLKANFGFGLAKYKDEESTHFETDELGNYTDVPIDKFTVFGGELAFTKRFFFGRVAPRIEAGFGYSAVSDNTKGETVKGVFVGAGQFSLDFSITQKLIVGFDVGYTFGLGEAETQSLIKANPSGMKFGLSVNWTPAYLAFDPFGGLL